MTEFEIEKIKSKAKKDLKDFPEIIGFGYGDSLCLYLNLPDQNSLKLCRWNTKK